MKNAIIIAFISVVLCPVLINTGIFTYYSFDVKGFTEKFCINKAEPELRCNGKCKLKSIVISSGPKSESKKNLVRTFKVPFFSENLFAYSFLRKAWVGKNQAWSNSAFVLLQKSYEVLTPPPQ